MFGQKSLKPIRTYSEVPLAETTHGEEKELTDSSFQHKLPTPPSSRPSSLRRLRHRSLRGNKSDTDSKTPSPDVIPHKDDLESSMFNLQKYKLLPAICSQDTRDGSDNVLTVFKMDTSSQDRQRVETQSEVLSLAIRLPDGSRHEHSFSSVSTFKDIVEYMRSVASSGVPSNCEFVTSGVPQQIFSDLSVSLYKANIGTRTLLNLRDIDPD